MSYDLFIFEASKAPKTKEEFLAWYDKQTEWSENHGYSDISVASPALQKFYKELRKTYIMGDEDVLTAEGKTLAEEESAGKDGEYIRFCSIGREMMYIGFSYTNAVDICEEVEYLASDCGVGFYSCSGACEVIFPDGEIIYDCYLE